MLASDLEGAIAAVCPIRGVRIGSSSDRSTWQIDFEPGATAAERQAAQTVLASFVSTDASQMAAAAKIAAGLTITSTGTPALNGTYALDAGTRANIQAVVVYILVNSRFPGGVQALPWPDKAGTPHQFPTTALFLAFATAIADYVAAVDLASAQPSPTWPTATATIP